MNKKKTTKKTASRKLCCKELTKAVAYKNPSFHYLNKKLITLHLGDVYVKPEKALKIAESLLKAVNAKDRSLIPTQFSGKLPVSVPIKFCPFCGNQIREDLLHQWA